MLDAGALQQRLRQTLVVHQVAAQHVIHLQLAGLHHALQELHLLADLAFDLLGAVDRPEQRQRLQQSLAEGDFRLGHGEQRLSVSRWVAVVYGSVGFHLGWLLVGYANTNNTTTAHTKNSCVFVVTNKKRYI